MKYWRHQMNRERKQNIIHLDVNIIFSEKIQYLCNFLLFPPDTETARQKVTLE
jgi:hypothetical protein